MNIEDRLVFLVIVVSIGVGLFILGLNIRVGKYKSWWLIKDTPIVPIVTAYIGIPASIAFFILASIAFFQDINIRREILVYYAGPLLIVACILAIWHPRWLAPQWLLWLEDYHDDILPLLKKEAQAMGAREWSQSVSTQEGLEEWVAEVRHKYRL